MNELGAFVSGAATGGIIVFLTIFFGCEIAYNFIKRKEEE